MKNNLHIAEQDLALYAMGALSQEEMEAARGHVAGCARCTEELRRDTLALAAYAQTTPEAALPDGAKERFMTRLAASSTTREVAQPRRIKLSWRVRFGFGPIAWTGALAGALAVLLLVVGLDDLHRRAEMLPLLALVQQDAVNSAHLAQLMELLTSSHAQRVSLHQTTVAMPPPEGRVVYSADSGKLLLTAQNLKPLPAGKTYELWILMPDGKMPLPAGTFSPDSSGNAAMVLADVPGNLAVAGFGVTVENAGGSQTPTLPIVLSGL
jgi:anti-sigma-K factor RskA